MPSADHLLMSFFALVPLLELDILPSMHWLAYLKKLSALLIAAMLAVEFLLTCKRPLIQSTIESYCKNWNIMVSGELPFSGSSHTCLTGNSLFR